MRKLLYFFVLWGCVSCSLDLPVEDEITGLDAIDNVFVADEALSSAYLSFPKNRLVFSVLADDFYPNHQITRKADTYQLYNWAPKELILISLSEWREYYATISKLNVLLHRIPEIRVNNESEKNKLNYIEAQALSLKAYCYFRLLQEYTQRYDDTTKSSLGIIIKNKIDEEQLPRVTLEESYQATEELLIKSIALFKNVSIKEKHRFSSESSQMLLAKLYLNWKKYPQAIELCDKLINNNDITKENYTLMWETPSDSPEVSLVFENNLHYFNLLSNASNKEMFYINRTIDFSNADYRKSITFLPGTFINLSNQHLSVNYLGKYRKTIESNIARPIIAMRKAELYFIKSEAQYHSGKINEAKNTLNEFLTLRKAELVDLSGHDFLVALLKEKQKEFLGEGVRYFDIKRNEIPLSRVNFSENVKVSEITPDDFKWQLPLPKEEIKQNKNAKQNPQWENYVY